MHYDLSIGEMKNGDEVEGFFILRSAQVKTASNGRPFLNAVLADCTGIMDAKSWDYPGPLGQSDEGKIVKIRGSVGEYRGIAQLTIDRIRAATQEDAYDLSRLVATAPIDAERELAQIRRLIASVEDTDYRGVCETMLERHLKAFISIPAAKSVHHSFLRGLLMHTAKMLASADFLAGLYADTVDRSLLLTGTLLHDFGKREEFAFSELGLVTDYTVKGQLLGHLVMGAQEAAELCRERNVPEEKSILLQHMILSHHGEPEFGAAVRPMCAESELLSLIDQIDSKMEIYRETMDETPKGQLSTRVFALDRRIYHHE